MTMFRGKRRIFAAGLLLATFATACGDDADSTVAPASTTAGATDSTEGSDTTEAGSDTTEAVADTTEPSAPSEACPTSGEAITLAVNPWTGSAVNAYVAKSIIECELGTPVEIIEIDENATWVGLDDGSIDAVLEIWPSGHAADFDTYIAGKGSVVDLGPLGPSAKIGWYVPKFVVDAHPELATWEGFQNPELAKLFATAESGDLGQFTMGDPSYVTYDEQIIANLGLPLKYVVAGSEAALLTAIDQSIADQKPILMQFWQPHWKQLEVELVEVKLPDISPACEAALASQDGTYACDYPVDELYKAANAGLEEKNAAAFNLLKNLQLTTEQQSEIAGYVDRDGMSAAEAGQKWVDANAAVWQAWLS
ncbi:MAG: glycine betaine ABC transporter substrate-binding protein [Actinomycetota bacterium]|nr:glycine betaine ABC transporter substrate-binding protein [Actinomycetota bacterium]